MKNIELAKILKDISAILELKGIEFKPRAYQKAAQTIESLSEDLDEIYKKEGIKGLKKLSGVGESIAKKIEEFLKTGKIKAYEQLKKKTKIDLESLRKIPGLGPKKIRLLYKKLKIKNINELEKAIKKQKLRKIRTLGKITEERLTEGVELVKRGKGRLLLGDVYPLAEEIKNYLKKVEGVTRVEIAGSFRRGKETVGDLDILVISKKPKKVIDAFTSMSDVKKVVAQGTTKATIRLKNDFNIDLRVLKEKEFGSALLYFTGSKQHNIDLRKIALKKGYTLSEYGLFKLKRKIWVAGRTEEEIYKKLGMQYIPPEIRENSGEIQAALQNKIPKLIEYKDLIGDFHMHSKWSDGSNTIKEMIEQAKNNGLKIIAVTDHIGDIGVANSLKGKRFSQYIKELEKVSKNCGIIILKGAEIDINKKGELRATKNMLKELDIVLGAVHMSFTGSEKEQTNRLCSAMKNYPINILAHPSARRIGRRNPINLDMERIFETAKRTNTFLGINGQPNRMDLDCINIKKAKERGCNFVLNSDSHSTTQLNHLKLAVINARKGWLEKKDVLNCWSIDKIKKILKK